MNMRRATWPEGNNLLIQRDLLGNALTITSNPKPGSGEQPIVTSQTFPYLSLFYTTQCVLCTKPITRTDALGNVTDYTYDPVHGGVLTEILPTVNGVRPQTRTAYVQRQAMVRDAAGNIVASGAPIWLLAQTATCRTGAASGNGCAIAGDETITTYDYGPTSGPNNLLLRGVVVDAGGLNLRTFYSYDWQGNRISTTAPEGTTGWASCP